MAVNLLRTAEPGLLGAEPGNLEPGGVGVLVAGSVPQSTTYPLIAHLFAQAGGFKKLLGKLNNVPTISAQLNGGQGPITLDLPAADTSANAPVQGDLVKLTQGGGPDSQVIYTGIIEDLPDDLDINMRHSIDLVPLAAELDLAPVTQNYTVNTDVAQMVRDAVAQTSHLFVTPESCPKAGVTGQANFNQVTALQVLDTARKIGGVNFYYFVDEIGCVWFGQANTAASATYTVKRGVDYQSRKYRSPIAKLKNHIPVNGGIAPGTSAPMYSLYHNATSVTQYGVRALFPAPTFPNITDQATLDAIRTTLGAGLDRRITRVDLDLNNFSTRIQLKRGATLRYWEPNKNTDTESETGTGNYSPTYVILETHQLGPNQAVVVSDIPVAGVDDFQYEIDRIMERTSLANLSYVPAALNVVGQINGGGFQTSGVGTARWIIDGTSIRAEDGTSPRPRVEMGNLPANGVSAAGWKFRANDATGAPIFDSDGLIAVANHIASSTFGSSSMTAAGIVPGSTTTTFSPSRSTTYLILAMMSGWGSSTGAVADLPVQLLVSTGDTSQASLSFNTGVPLNSQAVYVFITLPAGSYTVSLQAWSIPALRTLNINAGSVDVIRLGS